MTLKSLVAHLRFQMFRHGWPAVAGLTLLIAALGLHGFGVLAAQESTAALRTEQATLHESARAQSPQAQDTGKQQQLALYAHLPDSRGALLAVDQIHRSAGVHRVELASGEYRVMRDAKGQMARYQITLPARSSYPNLRAWLAEVMNTVPTVALDDISFQRDMAASDVVDARVRLTLWMRAL